MTDEQEQAKDTINALNSTAHEGGWHAFCVECAAHNRLDQFQTMGTWPVESEDPPIRAVCCFCGEAGPIQRTVVLIKRNRPYGKRIHCKEQYS